MIIVLQENTSANDGELLMTSREGYKGYLC